jgi:hypothetical protein
VLWSLSRAHLDNRPTRRIHLPVLPWDPRCPPKDEATCPSHGRMGRLDVFHCPRQHRKVRLTEEMGQGKKVDPPFPHQAHGRPRCQMPCSTTRKWSKRQVLPALELFFRQPNPPRMLVRSAHLLYIRYGFANASVTGLSASITTNQGVRVRIGIWGQDSQDETLNWREFESLVTTLEAEGERGNLDDAAVVMCTDNLTAESATNRASSTSPKLYRLAVRLRALQFRHGAQFIVSHVAGERMKDQGTDGVSRGHLQEGIVVGDPMIKFIPFHKSALTSSPTLRAWLKSWVPAGAEFLEPEGWFERGHGQDGGKKDTQGFWIPTIRSGTFVWTPPPAAARIAVEQLWIARIKRQNSLHIVCIPSLLSHEWSRMPWKAADVVFKVPRGVSFWPAKCF